MAVQFAGSRSIDDRRRRRLASENEEQVSQSDTETRASGSQTIPTSSATHKKKWRPPTPFHSLVPPRRWILCLGVVGLFLCWGSLLRTAFQLETGAISLSTDYHRLFNFQSGALWNILPGALFMMTAQLSWVVYWFRKRCPNDFDGQYKIWFWAASVWMIVGVVTLLGLHNLMRQNLIQMFHIPNQALGPWIWLAPLSALVLEIVRGLDIEMGRCRLSWAFLGTALIASTLYTAQLTGWHPFPTTASNMIFLYAAGTLIPLALFTSVLFHTWHVLYVSDAPEQERDSESILAIRKVVSITGSSILFLFQKSYAIIGSLLLRLGSKKLNDENVTEAKTEAKTEAEHKTDTNKNKDRTSKKKQAKKKPVAKVIEAVVETTESSSTKTTEQPPKQKKKGWFSFGSKKETATQTATPEASSIASPDVEEIAELNSEPVQQTPSQMKLRRKKKSVTPEQPAPVEQTHQRLDSAEEIKAPATLDPAKLKGLSKSERRKLRKEFREAQRAAKRS